MWRMSSAQTLTFIALWPVAGCDCRWTYRFIYLVKVAATRFDFRT